MTIAKGVSTVGDDKKMKKAFAMLLQPFSVGWYSH